MPDKRMKRSWAAPVEHVNRRRESIAAEGADKLDGQPAVGFQGILDAGAPLDLGEEMKQRRRPQAVQVQGKALTAHPCISSLRLRPVLLYLLNVNASKQLTSKRITFPASRLGR
jgi:hypothetical protein